jgi:hypothetical protein
MRRFAAWLSIGSLFLTFLGSAQAVDAGNGLSASAGGPPWARWQGRVSVSTGTPQWRSEMLRSEPFGLKVQGITLMGDYYFTRSRLGEHGAGGFRATSGVLVGQGALWTSQPASGIGTGLSVGQRNTSLFSGLAGSELTSESTTVPYVGVGYSGLSPKGGWGFAADVGVKALQAGTPVRFGRAVNGSPSLDELVRELRLTPVLQLGVSYSF